MAFSEVYIIQLINHGERVACMRGRFWKIRALLHCETRGTNEGNTRSLHFHGLYL